MTGLRGLVLAGSFLAAPFLLGLVPGLVWADVRHLDLAADAARQVVVDREPGQYLGHPTTVLLEDGATVLCVYPRGHGRGAICLKRSPDGGRTWSERLPVPDNWATSKETPTIHRVVDAAGRKRLVVFSGLNPARMAVSDDDGVSWSGLAPLGDWGGIVVMGSVVPLRTGPDGGHRGDYLGFFHDDGRFIAPGSGAEKPVRFTLYATHSTDGGLHWGEPRSIWSSTDVHLCEPGVIRSPDGRRLAMLLRENARRKNSHVMFSDDEGDTWTEPRELPRSLTGDRHVAAYAPDGRLFVSFRDTAKDSPTAGDWVAWVGTWDDIAAGRDGQYRVRLMDNTHAWDCAYPGVEVLPDGTILTTTYGHWVKGEPPFIVSIRLTLEELDRLAEQQPGDGEPRAPPEDPVTFRRLPDYPEPPGVAGAFCGVAGGHLLVAGGANFPDRPPWDGGAKVWHDRIAALDAAGGRWRILEGRLPRPLGYGVAATWRDAVACVGGSSAAGHHGEAFLIRRDGDRAVIEPLPPLPTPLANTTGLVHGSTLVVIGGITAADASAAESAAWALDLAAPDQDRRWRPLPPLPGPGRMLAGCGLRGDTLVVFGGTALRAGADGLAERVPLTDGFRIDLAAPDTGWRPIAPLPRPVIAPPVPAFALPDRELLVLGGDDGVRPAAGPAAHQGFPREMLAYDPAADRWRVRGAMPETAVTTGAVAWHGQIVVASGERRPGVRTTAVWLATPRRIGAKPAADPAARMPPRPERTEAERAAAAARLREIYGGEVAGWPTPLVDPGVEWRELAPLPAVVHPEANPPNAAKTRLGQLLFFDPRLSASGNLSCGACHDPRSGWAAGREPLLPKGTVSRNAPTIRNAAFVDRLFWDGRASSLEEQVRDSIGNPAEMAADPVRVVDLLSTTPAYRDLFSEAFAGRPIDFDGVIAAIASFQRSVIGGQSRFDAFLRGDHAALSDDALLGLDLFRREARCINCHHGPTFSDGLFHDLGLSFYGRSGEDLGRYRVTGAPDDVGRFRTPGLRDVTQTGPLMHSGRYYLQGVLAMYNAGMPDIKRHAHQRDDGLFPVKSPHLRPLGLNRQDLADLAAFLAALEEPGWKGHLPRPSDDEPVR
ncbi:MAG: cytochrome c peroxidase [Planctomycetaceae bacterium]